MSLTDAQIQALLAPIDPGRVRQVQGNSHLEAWDVRRWLLRIFGWGGWQFDVISSELVSQRSIWEAETSLKGRHSVVYRVVGRLVIRDPEGVFVTSWEDGAVGDAQNQPSLGDAHDQALKTAMSQALKRCAINLGEVGGLPLYNGGRTMPVVGKSIAHSAVTEHVTAESVSSGEMDAPAIVPEHIPDPPVEVPTASPGEAAPPNDVSESGLPFPDSSERVGRLRAKVEEILAGTNARNQMADLTRVNLAAGKERLMNELIDVEGGQITVAVYLDNALKTLARSAS